MNRRRKRKHDDIRRNGHHGGNDNVDTDTVTSIQHKESTFSSDSNTSTNHNNCNKMDNDSKSMVTSSNSTTLDIGYVSSYNSNTILLNSLKTIVQQNPHLHQLIQQTLSDHYKYVT